jgi:hypothetical protein
MSDLGIRLSESAIGEYVLLLSETNL